MLLVVGGAQDTELRAAIDRLGPGRAVLLSAADLSTPGWKLSPQNPDSGEVVASGAPLAVAAIGAVLVRRQAVYQQELTHVHPDDRAYAAAEMTALLAWWLRALKVPVLNRPSNSVLCGPAWREEQWRLFATRQGLAAASAARSSDLLTETSVAAWSVSVVGPQAFGDAPHAQKAAAIRLADKAKTPLLRVRFDAGGAVMGADCFPPLTPDVIEAIAAWSGPA